MRRSCLERIFEHSDIRWKHHRDLLLYTDTPAGDGGRVHQGLQDRQPLPLWVCLLPYQLFPEIANLDKEKGAMKHPTKWNLANLNIFVSSPVVPELTMQQLQCKQKFQGYISLDKSHMANHAHRAVHMYIGSARDQTVHHFLHHPLNYTTHT